MDSAIFLGVANNILTFFFKVDKLSHESLSVQFGLPNVVCWFPNYFRLSFLLFGHNFIYFLIPFNERNMKIAKFFYKYTKNKRIPFALANKLNSLILVGFSFQIWSKLIHFYISLVKGQWKNIRFWTNIEIYFPEQRKEASREQMEGFLSDISFGRCGDCQR